MLGNKIANYDDDCAGTGAEVYLFLQQRVPSVVSLGPREARVINKHRSLGKISNVISLRRPAEITSNAKMKNEVLNRKEKVPESRFYSRPCMVCRTSPPAQGRLHTYQNVLNGP